MKDTVTIRFKKSDIQLKEFANKQKDLTFWGRLALYYLMKKTGIKDLSNLKSELERVGFENVDKLIEK